MHRYVGFARLRLFPRRRPPTSSVRTLYDEDRSFFGSVQPALLASAAGRLIDVTRHHLEQVIVFPVDDRDLSWQICFANSCDPGPVAERGPVYPARMYPPCVQQYEHEFIEGVVGSISVQHRSADPP